MIIQTGNRTDIPAFYADWFANRLQEGFVLVRNPFNPVSITKYRLDPSVVDLIVFCSKNPAPMLKYMHLLEPYHQYWFVTITPYGKDIEPHVPDKAAVLETFRKLSAVVGADNMCWRYDPIIIDQENGACKPHPNAAISPHAQTQTARALRTGWTMDRHIEAFTDMCRALAGYTHTVVISFIDLYEKVKRNFPEAAAIPMSAQLALTKAFVEIARKYDLTIKPCGESPALASVGADCSGCMTQKVFEDAIGQNLLLPSNPKNRKECACYITGDIGAYNTCGHLCRYCYANSDRDAVRTAMKQHDPESPLLIGHPEKEDTIHEAKQLSWIDPQMRLDLW